MIAATEARKVWTETQLQALPHDSCNCELVDGELVMSPKNNFIHGSFRRRGAKPSLAFFRRTITFCAKLEEGWFTQMAGRIAFTTPSAYAAPWDPSPGEAIALFPGLACPAANPSSNPTRRKPCVHHSRTN